MSKKGGVGRKGSMGSVGGMGRKLILL